MANKNRAKALKLYDLGVLFLMDKDQNAGRNPGSSPV